MKINQKGLFVAFKLAAAAVAGTMAGLALYEGLEKKSREQFESDDIRERRERANDSQRFAAFALGNEEQQQVADALVAERAAQAAVSRFPDGRTVGLRQESDSGITPAPSARLTDSRFPVRRPFSVN